MCCISAIFPSLKTYKSQTLLHYIPIIRKRWQTDECLTHVWLSAAEWDTCNHSYSSFSQSAYKKSSCFRKYSDPLHFVLLQLNLTQQDLHTHKRSDLLACWFDFWDIHRSTAGEKLGKSEFYHIHWVTGENTLLT